MGKTIGRVLDRALRLGGDVIAAAGTALSAALDAFGVASPGVPYQWFVVIGIVVFGVLVFYRVHKLNERIETRDSHTGVANGLSEFLTQGEQLMATIVRSDISVTTEDYFKWSGPTYAYLMENCGKSYAELFLNVDHTQGHAAWTWSDQDRPDDREFRTDLLTQVSSRMRTLRETIQQFQRLAASA